MNSIPQADVSANPGGALSALRKSMMSALPPTSASNDDTTALATPPASPSIEQHWQDLCTAYREFDRDPDAIDDEARARSYWNRIDAAEIAILNSPEAGVRAAELRLWVAWSHTDETNREAVAQGDVPALLRIRDDLDWHEKLIFTAILNLRGEG